MANIEAFRTLTFCLTILCTPGRFRDLKTNLRSIAELVSTYVVDQKLHKCAFFHLFFI